MANSVNAGPIATAAQAKAGTDTKRVITPYNALQAISARGLKFNVQNLAMASGVLTSSNGSALSPTNFGRVAIPSKLDRGTFVVYQVESFQSLSVSTGNIFGATNSVAWSIMPLYIYAVSNNAEDDITFFLSRVPHRTTAPSASFISSGASTNASTQGSFYTARSITPSDYAGNPCVLIGGLSSCSKTAPNAWTTGALNGAPYSTWQVVDFIDNNTRYVFPTLQFGATIDHGLPNGGTPPNFSTSSIQYIVSRDGWCFVYININGLSVAGSGAVNMQITMPFAPAYDAMPLEAGTSIISGTNTMVYPVIYSGKYVEFRRCTTGAPLLNTDAVANLTGVFSYPISID